MSQHQWEAQEGVSWPPGEVSFFLRPCTCILTATCHLRSGVEISTCDIMPTLRRFQF
jgi:hypothetical protein